MKRETLNVPPTSCRKCGQMVDTQTAVTGASGSHHLAICLYCGCISIIADDRTLRSPTIGELLDISRDRELQRAMAARALVMRGHPKSR